MRIRLTNAKFQAELTERGLRAIASSGITLALAYDPSGVNPTPNFGQASQDNPATTPTLALPDVVMSGGPTPLSGSDVNMSPPTASPPYTRQRIGQATPADMHGYDANPWVPPASQPPLPVVPAELGNSAGQTLAGQGVSTVTSSTGAAAPTSPTSFDVAAGVDEDDADL